MNPTLAKAGHQLHAIWKQLGLNQKISIVLTTGVVLAGLLALGIWSSRPDYALLYGKLNDTEAADVVAALDESGIPYQISRGGDSISVPSDQVHSVRMQLANKGIPKGEGVGFEIFDKPNFGISDFVQRANYVRAIQGELARTISQLDEVESARVMIVIPENRLLVEDPVVPTASVFVQVPGRTPLPVSSVNSIRFLVANAVENLKPNNVTVVDNQGTVLSENYESDSLTGLSNTQLKARQGLEKYLSQKAEGMLETVLGPGQAVVRVAAEINWDSVSRTEETYDPESQVVRSETITDETTDTITTRNNGVPGVASNTTIATNNTQNVPTNNTKTEKKVSTNEYEISKTTSNILQSAGGIKRISAAVFVAAQKEDTGTERQIVQRTPEQLDKLRRIVQSALGIRENTNAPRQDEITLEEIEFNDRPLAEITRVFEQQDRRQFWWNLAKNIVYPVLGLGILFAFWRAYRRTPAPEIPIGIPLGDLGNNGNGNGNGNGHGAHGGAHKRQEPGVVTVDVLNQLIREQPDNMTQAVRNWLSRNPSDSNSS